ncbi:MAG TPA: hypothetical protein VFD46_15065 [Chryseolinea sp.]|nr:hypothetical protein [Chryseolinea sp.]
MELRFMNLMKNIKVQSHKGATDTVLPQVSVGREFYYHPMRMVESRQGRQIV